MVASMMLPPGPSSSATRRSSSSAARTAARVTLGPPALHLDDLLGLDLVVDLEDVLDLAVAEQR